MTVWAAKRFFSPTGRRRLVVAGFVVVASLAVVSLARAGFKSSASAGPQSLSSASLSPATAPRSSCSNGVATISWTATPSTFAGGYEILRGTKSGGPYTHLATITPRTTVSYSDSSIVNGTYYYVVQATKQNWRSASTSQVSVDTNNC